MKESPYIVSIFPGHVGKDPGAIDKVSPDEDDSLFSIEAVINGQISNFIKEKLDTVGIKNQICGGSFSHRINHSRYSDLGVSIHCDSFPDDPRVGGFTIYHYPGSSDGYKLAEFINQAMDDMLDGYFRNRGIKEEANYAILRDTEFPCVLVECGFLTNPADEALLSDYYMQQKIAHAISTGIMLYENQDIG